jgi:hypothetical protein
MSAIIFYLCSVVALMLVVVSVGSDQVHMPEEEMPLGKERSVYV